MFSGPRPRPSAALQNQPAKLSSHTERQARASGLASHHPAALASAILARIHRDPSIHPSIHSSIDPDSSDSVGAGSRHKKLLLLTYCERWRQQLSWIPWWTPCESLRLVELRATRMLKAPSALSRACLLLTHPPRRLHRQVEDALVYLDHVKLEFSSTPEVYNKFLDIMKVRRHSLVARRTSLC
jgi:hypothetical protein